MDDLELISDGDGMAVIGKATAVESFLRSLGLLDLSEDLGVRKLGNVIRAGASAADAGVKIAAESGRWVKITEESARAVKEFGFMESKIPGVSHAMIGKPGAISSWIQVESGLGSILTNPAVLASAAGLMAQLASQHEMNQIREYLARIDRKVDEVLRNQRYAEWAKMAGAGSVIRDAMTMRETKGGVDETTWSKIQGTPETIASAQRYALLQLNALAEKLENTSKMGLLAKTSHRAEAEVGELLAVLARCFELQDAVDVLELDRVLAASPDEVEVHRLGLKVARESRRNEVLGITRGLMERLDVAANAANLNVLLHRPSSRVVVDSVNDIGVAVDDFHTPLGIEAGRASVESARWWEAIRSPEQRKSAGAEVGRKAPAVAVVVVGVGILAPRVLKLLAKRFG